MSHLYLNSQQIIRHRIYVREHLATPARVGAVEEILKQGPLTYERVRQARDRFAEVIAPRAGSLRATPEYKKEMVGQLMEMALAKLAALEYRLGEVARL
ncbi:hypothetical protein [Moorella sp. Hama-1]|uniref:hypothetical protein n=1 Tax=Moorella sp. Hama-1 TaxID=2138101 RepID=UPI002106E2BA|nr:hypothetical protein [Moorella sp. Hama-1]